jgi:hypothetical protein
MVEVNENSKSDENNISPPSEMKKENKFELEETTEKPEL